MKTVKDLEKVPYAHSERFFISSHIAYENERGGTSCEFDREVSEKLIEELKEYGVAVENSNGIAKATWKNTNYQFKIGLTKEDTEIILETLFMAWEEAKESFDSTYADTIARIRDEVVLPQYLGQIKK